MGIYWFVCIWNIVSFMFMFLSYVLFGSWNVFCFVVIDREKIIVVVVFVIEKVCFYRGKGGEIVWFVVFWLIEVIVKVKICLLFKI